MKPPLPVVLDTNVWVSLLIYRDPSLAPVDQALRAGLWRAQADEATLGELARVLGYPEFGLSPASQAALLAEAQGMLMFPPLPAERPPAPPCRDEDDRKFLALARDGGAQWLITSDKVLLALGRRGKRHPFGILSPRRAIAKLLEAETGGNGP